MSAQTPLEISTLPSPPREMASGSCEVFAYFCRFAFTIVNLLLIAAAACTLLWPMGRDQGIFAWVGDCILHGGVPYRDAWEVKGPAAHYTAALAIALFGHNIWSIRLLDLVLTGIGSAALWRLCRNLADRFAANLAVIFYLLWYWGLGYWHTAQPDAWLGVFQLLALMLLVRKEQSISVWPMALAGACLGIVTLFKLPFAACAIVLIPASWRGRENIGKWVLLATAGAIGFIVPLLITTIAFAHWGALRDLVDIQFTFNALLHRNSNHLSLAQHAYWIVQFITNKGTIFFIAAILLGLIQLCFGSDFNSNVARATGVLVTFLLLVIDMVLVPLQQKYFPYHWIPAFGPLAFLVGLASFRINSALKPFPENAPHTRVLRHASIIVLIIALLWNAVGMVRSFGPLLPSLVHLRSWEAYERTLAGQTYLDQKQVAQYISQRTAPDDTLLQWGFDPLINYLAARRAPTRFGFNYALVRSTGALQEKWRRQFMSDLAAHPPAYLVIAENDANNLMLETSVDYMKQFPELEKFVREHYEKETQIRDYQIWRRKDFKH